MRLSYCLRLRCFSLTADKPAQSSRSSEWLVIDPKGVYGEPEFEAAWFDYVHENELQNKDIKKIFHQRIESLAQKANFDSERLKNWVFVRLVLSAVWSMEDNSDPELALRLAELV